MFGIDKLKERIEALEQENLKLSWLIENPPIYKIGDKTKHGVVCSVTLNEKPKHPVCDSGLNLRWVCTGWFWTYGAVKKGSTEVTKF